MEFLRPEEVRTLVENDGSVAMTGREVNLWEQKKSRSGGYEKPAVTKLN